MNTALTPDVLRQSWRSWWSSDLRTVGPSWLRLVWTFLFSALLAVGFTILGFAAFANGEGAWRNLPAWWQWYQVNLMMTLVIGYLIHFMFFASVSWLTPARIRRWPARRRTLFFAGVPMLGTAIGWPLGAALTGYELISWRLVNNPNSLVASVLIAVLISAVFHFVFAAKAGELQAEKRAAEAQLRLLQGQIEPHFLFNTLANVQALIDHDAARAKRMLDTFTDYLRASLGSMRGDSATLAGELSMVQAYLDLLKMRMEDRLQFSLHVEAAAHGARLPPLLLQPLVENAIHHGLEPKVEGGQVQVTARVQAGMLVLQVADDGLGLDHRPRRKAGAGVALANLRERLLAQYGNEASLTLQSNHPGTLATLRLPFETQGALP